MSRLFTIWLLLSVISIGPLGCTPAAEPPVPPDMDTMDAGAKEVIERELTMVRANPSHAPAWMQLGRVYIAHQIPAAAATCFLHVSGITPSPEADYLHAVALDALGDVAGRRQAIDAAIAAGGPQTSPLWRAALWAMEEGDLTRAAELAERAANHSAAGYADTTVLARVRMAQGRAEETVDLLTPLVQTRPTDGHAHWVLGRALQATGQHESGSRHLVLAGNAEATFHDPWMAQAEATRADMSARMGTVAAMARARKFDQATQAMQSLRTMYGDLREVQLAEATLLFMKGEHDRSASMLNRIIERWPKWFPPNAQQASQYLQRAKRGVGSRIHLTSARSSAEEAVAISPGKVEGWLLLANVARAQQDDDAALDAFTRAIELAPERSAPRIARAELLSLSGHPQAAINALDDDELVFGPSLAASLVRVQALMALGRAEEAYTLFEQCRIKAPNHRGVQRMARLLERARQ